VTTCPVKKQSTRIFLLSFSLLFIPGCGSEHSNRFADDFSAQTLSEELWIIDKKGLCEISTGEGALLGKEKPLRIRAGPKSRCEVVPLVFPGLLGRYRHEPFHQDRWYEFSFYLKDPWQAGKQNEILAQWHAAPDFALGDVPSRGPPLALRIYGDQFRVTSGWDTDFISSRKWIARTPLWSGPVQTGRWLTWRFRVRWSYEEDGLIQAWLNDRLIIEHKGPNAYNDLRGVYLKLGVYHPNFDREVYLDDVFVADQAP